MQKHNAKQNPLPSGMGSIKLFQSYVIEADGTKRPMTKQEFREMQERIAIVPFIPFLAILAWVIKLIYKEKK
jgi:hypothetical protein